MNAVPSTGFTWEAWIKPNTVSGSHAIIGSADGASCEDFQLITSGSEISFVVDGSGCGQQGEEPQPHQAQD